MAYITDAYAYRTEPSLECIWLVYSYTDALIVNSIGGTDGTPDSSLKR